MGWLLLKPVAVSVVAVGPGVVLLRLRLWWLLPVVVAGKSCLLLRLLLLLTMLLLLGLWLRLLAVVVALKNNKT